MSEKKSVSSEEKIWGAISYLWILSLVVLIVKKDNDFVRFHVNQGVLLFAISLPFMLLMMVGWLVNFILGIIAIIGIIKALQGERWELPLLADTAKAFGDWVIKTIKL